MIQSVGENKQLTGLVGEMHLAMELQKLGWQVHRAYIDSLTDFVLTRFWCRNCQDFSDLEKRNNPNGGNFPTNLCMKCLQEKLISIVRFVQVKTSEGVDKGDYRDYSFHAKLRSNADPRSFYTWIALIPTTIGPVPHYYIFHHSEINKFDNINLASYQETDNQKTTLRINIDGIVCNKGRKYDFNCFNDEFHNNFKKLEIEFLEDIGIW